MRIKIIVAGVALLTCAVLNVRAQEPVAAQDAGAAQRVSLEEQPVALDALGRVAIAGQLLTKALSGAPDAPVKNARFIIENRSQVFYTYVTGSVTFYDERGVRCGEGQFTLNALAPNEQAETDAPGLRLSCAPRTWRIVANNLLTRASETAKPVERAAEPTQPAPMNTPAMQSLEIVVDDQVYNAPLGSTLEVPVKNKRVKITVRPSQ
ncbi:MAG TPA: hypothetical protein VGN95_04160 [Pyrinomonadaceae bacterium]|nr:hypothetical protein [Pyrinomonadaceae bacterium]